MSKQSCVSCCVYATSACTYIDVHAISACMYVNVPTMDVIAARCVDLYLEQRNQKAANSDKVDIDGRLAAIVERMFERYGRFSALYFVMPHPL